MRLNGETTTDGTSVVKAKLMCTRMRKLDGGTSREYPWTKTIHPSRQWGCTHDHRDPMTQDLVRILRHSLRSAARGGKTNDRRVGYPASKRLYCTFNNISVVE